MHPAKVPLAETWGAMEELVTAGLTRQIGVCNYGVSILRDLLAYARIRPTVLQIELHPYLCQEKLLRFCREEAITVTGFSPLGAPSYVPLGMAKESDSVLDHPVVTRAAAAHNRTPAQVVLRWGVQRGTGVIPKTSRPSRLPENLAIFDFDGYDYKELGMTPEDTIRDLNHSWGHGLVLSLLLEGIDPRRLF